MVSVSGKKSTKKNQKKTYEIFIAMIFARARENHRMRVREKGKSMGKGGRGDERRYMGVCSDGFGRREVDDEQVEWCADESCITAIGGVKIKGRTLHNDSAPDAQLGGVMYNEGGAEEG